MAGLPLYVVVGEQKIPLEMDPSATVADVLDELKKMGHPPMDLLFGGTQLNPGDALADTGIGAQATLTVSTAPCVLTQWKFHEGYPREHSMFYYGNTSGGRTVLGAQSVDTGRIHFTVKIHDPGDKDIHLGFCTQEFGEGKQFETYYPWSKKHAWTVKLNDGDLYCSEESTGTYPPLCELATPGRVYHLTACVETGEMTVEVIDKDPLLVPGVCIGEHAQVDEQGRRVIVRGLPQGERLWPVIGSNYNSSTVELLTSPP
eukprot:TRINITY_DN573_c3_g1_i1.p1 TRINITY_DN573_c3_g1~~TRINITY_DN573_c3_g1_i1.p1  ORF type:complete len:267 (+),score=51.85 TRINITY_DN573_c3_g1_i1:25-801(+)